MSNLSDLDHNAVRALLDLKREELRAAASVANKLREEYDSLLAEHVARVSTPRS